MVSKQISNYDFLIEFEFKMQILNFSAHYNDCEISNLLKIIAVGLFKKWKCF